MLGHVHLPPHLAIEKVEVGIRLTIHILTPQKTSDHLRLIPLLQVLPFIRPVVLEIENVEGSSTLVGITYLVLALHGVDLVVLSLGLFFHVLPSFEVALVFLDSKVKK